MFPVEAGQLLFPLSERGQEALSKLISTVFRPSYFSLFFVVLGIKDQIRKLDLSSSSVSIVLEPRTDVNSFDTRELFEEVVSPIFEHLDLKGFLSKAESFLERGEVSVKPKNSGSVAIQLTGPKAKNSKDGGEIERLVEYAEKAYLGGRTLLTPLFLLIFCRSMLEKYF